jgi:formate dehydrogenase gamma subunit
VVVYNPDPLRPYREVFSWIHRISGVCLIVFPMLAVTRGAGDFRVHLHNIRQAWSWVFDDLKWLALMGLAAVSRRISLPAQGKFNAAQKLNFMLVMSTYPLYIATGLLMWLTGAALLPWLIHFFMAIVATPFLLGHIFMATIPRSSRKAFQGMFSGFVDGDWAKHHHRRWYDETFAGSPISAGQRQVVMPNGNGKAADAPVDPARIESGLKALERHANDGRTSAAADLFRVLWPHARDAVLPPETLRGIITELQRRQDMETAAKASALLVLRESPDPIAVRCLLKVAEDTRRSANGRESARKIYAFLLKHGADSPYAGHFRKGLEETL